MGVLALVLAAFLIAPTPSASVTVSNATPGARPVELTLRLRYEMQCGYPGPGPVTVRFPTQERLPSRIAPAAVLVNGKPTGAVTVSGTVVTVALPPRPEILCTSIGPGTLILRFSPAARLGNPQSAGAYGITVQRRNLRFSTTLRIQSR